MEKIEEYIKNNIPRIDTFHPHYQEALEYILANNGKLFRSKLLLKIVEAYEPLLVQSSLQVAFAIEVFHTYSLIHDDLPAMDNSPLRRGKATLHTLYDDATAILIGDALNTYAFELIATSALREDVKVKLITLLAHNGGLSGMVLGQAIDLEFENKPLSLQEVEVLHRNKTAKLIAASMQMGAVIVDLDKKEQEALYQFGLDLGLLFQVQDDILDVTHTTKEAGKPTNLDSNKNSFINILGLKESLEYANNLAAKLEKEFQELDEPLQKALKDLMQQYLYRHKD